MTTMLKKITQEELDIVINNHCLWLAGDVAGKKTDLNNHDLSRVGHAWVGHAWVGHERVGHERVEHARGGHARGGHADADIQHNANRVAARYDDIRRRP